MQYLFPFLLSFSLLGAMPLKEDHWDQFKRQIDHEVVVRGFILDQGEGQWALSSHPPVKSCCSHLKAQEGVALRIDGDWSAVQASQVVEVRGLLQHLEGEGFSSLSLSNCRFEESPAKHSWFHFSLALGATAVAGLALLLKRR